jgi:threonine dehydrogenase-like Zn-dependent dehydrogenase
MKAVVFTGEGRVEVDSVPDPQIQESNDAIVKVTRTAICGSDLHLLDGKTPGMREGSVIGHEFVGVITDLGPGVARQSEGTRVLGSFLIACGDCPACSAGRFNFCANRRALGLGTFTGDLDGAQAEYVRVPGADLNLKLLDGALSGLSDEEALFGGDVLTTGFYAAELAEPSPEDVVVIVGAGPIGLFTAAALRGRCARVILLDSDETRVSFADHLLGAGTAFLVDDDPTPIVARETQGELASVAIDAVGVGAGVEGSLLWHGQHPRPLGCGVDDCRQR